MYGFARGILVSAFVLGLIIGIPALADDGCPELVSTAQGDFKGMTEEGHQACAWKNVPYAAPPVGDLRWKAPEPPKPHQGVYDATKVGAACMQPKLITSGGDLDLISEDCLNLNIWRPQKPGKFPVMFWIHGGGFRTGSGAFDIYNGARLAAEQEVVVVTINYRVGWQGFLSLPELAEEDPNGSAGNYGPLDIVEALRWVNRNIEAFGGDPENVTVFGQSAGGVCAAAMQVSPLTDGLMHKVIIMSGPADQAESLEDGYLKGEAWAAELGCEGPDRLACLRMKSAEEVTAEGGNLILTGGINFMPHIDGYLLDKDPISAMKSGQAKPIPMMAGTTRDEIKLYTMTILGTQLLAKPVVDKLMKKLTGPAYDGIMELYSYSEFRVPIDFFHQVATDMALASRAYDMAETMSPAAAFYLYRFDWDETRLPHKMGAFHSLDVPFVFGALDLDFALAKMVANKKTVEKAMPLVDDVMAYFANFAKNGNPNGPGLPEWPAYDSSTRLRQHLDTPITTQPVTAKDVERFNYMNSWSLEGMSAVPKKTYDQ